MVYLCQMENSQTPHLELPKPVNNPDGLNLESPSVPTPEQAARPEAAPSPQAPTTSAATTPQPAPNSILTDNTVSSVAQSSQLNDNPAIADDVDLIEKEWVNKARSIVERNKNDPYVQNKELNVFKADYMKKRYGKDIKVVTD